MNTSKNSPANRDGQTQGRHAVVLGGSLAGLLAARVLSDHFERVTLIERDPYSETAEPRRGMPQANHVHGLPVGRVLMRAFNLLVAPSALFQPKVLFRVLPHTIKPTRRPSSLTNSKQSRKAIRYQSGSTRLKREAS